MDIPGGISAPRAAVGAVVMKEGRVLLVKRSNAPRRGNGLFQEARSSWERLFRRQQKGKSWKKLG